MSLDKDQGSARSLAIRISDTVYENVLPPLCWNHCETMIKDLLHFFFHSLMDHSELAPQMGKTAMRFPVDMVYKSQSHSDDFNEHCVRLWTSTKIFFNPF